MWQKYFKCGQLTCTVNYKNNIDRASVYCPDYRLAAAEMGVSWTMEDR